MKLYIFGGENIKKRESIEIHRKAFKEAGKSPSILIFPWTFEIEKIAYREVMSDYFKNIGAGKIEYAELSDSFEQIKEKIEQSDLIYLPGGNEIILLNRLKERKIDKLLREYRGTISGNSAGSLILCEKYVVIKGQDEELKTTMKKGLGLVDFAITVHYGSADSESSGENPEEELLKLSKKEDSKIYAIPENCAVIYDGEIHFIGNIWQFYKGKKEKAN